MKEFFRGWRRKTGLITLLLACVFVSGWIRSFLVHDQIQIPSDESLTYCVSYDGQFQWSAMSGKDVLTGIELAKGPGRVARYSWIVTPISVFHNFPKGADPQEYNWRWQCCGFDFSDAKWQTFFPLQAGNVQAYCVPYWSIVIPLTLISLWLLLTKPRSSTPKKTVELIPSEGK